MEPQITFQGRGSGRGFLKHVRRHLDEGRTTFRDIGGRQLSSRAFHHVERASVRVENPRRPFHDQAVQIRRADRFGERLAQSMQEIEDQRLLDLDLFVRKFELAQTLSLLVARSGASPRDTQSTAQEE